MSSMTATAVLARPSAQVLDFNRAALDAYKRRQAAGNVEVMTPGNPLLEYIRRQPDEVVIDIGWVEEQLSLIADDKCDVLGDMAHDIATRLPGGANPASFILSLHELLREAQSRKLLEEWHS